MSAAAIIRESREQKVRRLMDAGAVEVHADPVQQVTVRGDHGEYTVFIAPHASACTCPAVGGCTHIDAAILTILLALRG